MESHPDQSPISTLKVDFHCSKECPQNVKKKLQGFSGVESISIDQKQGMVTVSGNVNPMVLVKLIQKMGQKAELWSFHKEPMKAQSHYCQAHSCCHRRSYSHSHSDDSSDDESLRGDTVYREHRQFKTMNSKISKKINGWTKRLGSKFGYNFVPPRPTYFPAPPHFAAAYHPFIPFHWAAPPMYPRPMTPYGGPGDLMMHRFMSPMVKYESYADNYRYPI